MENESKDPICRECGVELTDESWYVSDKKRHDYICKKCRYKYTKEWQQNNRDKHNQFSKKWQQNNRDKYNQSQREWHHNNRDKQNQLRKEERRQLRDEVIDAYGGKCTCCDETRREYLTIDHTNGGGNKHRREIGATSSDDLYRWLKQNNYPKGFQVLCFNCNCGKRNYSVCPHKKEKFNNIIEESYKIKNESNRVRKSILKLRLEVIEGYGGKCELCGEDNPYFLTIDHVNGDGAEERRLLGGQVAIYRKLRNNNYPKDNYRLLCYNCNCALGCHRITEEKIIQQNISKNRQ